MPTEADTCRRYIAPALQEAGWDEPPHSVAEQRAFTDGRIIPVGNLVHRLPQKRADYLLRYTRDLTLAVVEAKSKDHDAADGMQVLQSATAAQLDALLPSILGKAFKTEL